MLILHDQLFKTLDNLRLVELLVSLHRLQALQRLRRPQAQLRHRVCDYFALYFHGATVPVLESGPDARRYNHVVLPVEEIWFELHLLAAQAE